MFAISDRLTRHIHVCYFDLCDSYFCLLNVVSHMCDNPPPPACEGQGKPDPNANPRPQTQIKAPEPRARAQSQSPEPDNSSKLCFLWGGLGLLSLEKKHCFATAMYVKRPPRLHAQFSGPCSQTLQIPVHRSPTTDQTREPRARDQSQSP